MNKNKLTVKYEKSYFEEALILSEKEIHNAEDYQDIYSYGYNLKREYDEGNKEKDYMKYKRMVSIIRDVQNGAIWLQDIYKDYKWSKDELICSNIGHAIPKSDYFIVLCGHSGWKLKIPPVWAKEASKTLEDATLHHHLISHLSSQKNTPHAPFLTTYQSLTFTKSPPPTSLDSLLSLTNTNFPNLRLSSPLKIQKSSLPPQMTDQLSNLPYYHSSNFQNLYLVESKNPQIHTTKPLYCTWENSSEFSQSEYVEFHVQNYEVLKVAKKGFGIWYMADRKFERGKEFEVFERPKWRMKWWDEKRHGVDFNGVKDFLEGNEIEVYDERSLRLYGGGQKEKYEKYEESGESCDESNDEDGMFADNYSMNGEEEVRGEYYGNVEMEDDDSMRGHLTPEMSPF
ncbi:unnamed protein product [Moneuplotes crassus]|uniref:Uncharacterized protein n=1 Tax=Euplotes crassus TaxID=5936 RepID=A0AAD1URI5_EUPCR|nr:unnamed protein product [Moneuplotes crassus]